MTAEGNRQLSVFRDKYSEELAYPGIFLAQARPETKLLGKSHIALRKCKGNNKNIKAGHLKQQGALD